MRAAHPENDSNGPEQNADVAQQRPRADVLRLERNDLLEIGDLISSRDLPRSGDSRLHVEAGVVMCLVQVDFRRNRWPRTDERHLALPDVEQLRQLVETRPAEPSPDAGDARISNDLE